MLKVANVEMQNGKKWDWFWVTFESLATRQEKYHLEVAEAVMKLKPEFCVCSGSFGRFVSEEIFSRNVANHGGQFFLMTWRLLIIFLEHDFVFCSLKDHARGA